MRERVRDVENSGLLAGSTHHAGPGILSGGRAQKLESKGQPSTGLVFEGKGRDRQFEVPRIVT